MPVFQVISRDREGKTQQELITAENRSAALKVVHRRGHFVIAVEELRPPRTGALAERLKVAAAPITPDAQAAFFIHLAALLKSGHTVAAALASMAGRLDDSRLERLALEASAEAEKGAPLSECLAVRPGYLPSWVPAMVAAAESTGRVEHILPLIVRELRAADDFFRRLRLPIMYLKLSVGLGLLVPILPFAATIPFWHWVQWWVLPVYIPAALIAVVIAWSVRLLATRPGGQDRLSGWKLGLPGIGQLERELAVRRFLELMRVLYNAGVNARPAFGAAAAAAGHPSLVRRLQRGVRALDEGGTWQDAFQVTHLFPAVVLDAAATAERTGDIQKFLDWACDHYEQTCEEASVAARRTAWGMLLGLSALVILVAANLGVIALLKSIYDKAEQMFSVP